MLAKLSPGQQLLVAIVFTLLATSGAPAWAVGSGGLLNLVPQARVTLGHGDNAQEVGDAKVYVHPLEGSLVVILPQENSVLALDKNKRHTIQMPMDAVQVLDGGTIVDVPEDTPYTVLPGHPHFNRIHASVSLEDGRVLVVSVER